ncbi:uncharacterized protein TNIN_164861 [Trichonephila inaurata madagascariensis]|uniref:Uncharacterized protein n=1 Tax=Trichonephila inaurata madagascariensis TaxID=2747483 RepID=A0A8X7BZJ8_9ARAC|nr:uncharacterized protein TNIN_164861 [Trichonephila inaurata madagascariensis]
MLSLTDINSSQDEMQYISRMRNAFTFQTASNRYYKFLHFYKFQHFILCSLHRKSILETCLRHSLSKVIKSFVLVHNYSPFLQWTLISIDNDGFPEEGNPSQRQELIQRNDEYDQMERYLTANFGNALQCSADNGWSNWNLLQRQLLRNTRLSDLQINNADFLNSMHTSGWRRVFVDNFIDFNCTDTDIAAYVKGQTKERRSLHVFKEIFKRERGEAFNPFKILEFIASPYYYILPHHREDSHAPMNNVMENSMLGVLNDPAEDIELFCFESQLRIARKNIAHLVEIIH